MSEEPKAVAYRHWQKPAGWEYTENKEKADKWVNLTFELNPIVEHLHSQKTVNSLLGVIARQEAELNEAATAFVNVAEATRGLSKEWAILIDGLKNDYDDHGSRASQRIKIGSALVNLQKAVGDRK